MSTTVIEALLNAQANIELGLTLGNSGTAIICLSQDQLSNAIEALKNGLGPNEIIQENIFSEINVGNGDKQT